MQIDEQWINNQFEYSERHGISIPCLDRDWDELKLEHRIGILAHWEMIRGNIPEHIMRFEAIIRIKQQKLFEENDFVQACLINSEIADLASRVNDLNIWFRTQQNLNDHSKMHIG
ncbi:hypothetical protein [Cohnella sp. WQ 127256]|uniref:hypothetical protein n=1 Tax=Cohnella sp. WQ 127256 TaxID=2938790 RepID=UPI002118D68C|nr:hypothetical protein [Cohnella sp. WQ 127256]